MNRLQLHFVVLFILSASSAFSQQLSLFTQYREQMGILNPAAVSTDYLAFEQNITLGATYRSQWSDFEGAPRTQTVHGSYLYSQGSGVSLLTGGYLFNDQTGPTGNSGIYGRIGGVISGDPYYGGVAFGISAGLAQFRIRTSEIRFRDLNDVIAEGGDQSKLYPDVGIGAFAYARIDRGLLDDSYVYGGVSVPQVIGLDLTYNNPGGEFAVERVRHFYGMAGLMKFFRDDSFIEPSTWVKYTPGAPVNVDFNLRYQTAHNFWVGAGGSTAGTIHLDGGVLIGEMGFTSLLKIGYGFDYTFSTFGPTVGPAHEINIAYSFGN